MFFLTPYMGASQKEDEKPQGSVEQGRELLQLKYHSFPQRSWNNISLMG